MAKSVEIIKLKAVMLKTLDKSDQGNLRHMVIGQEHEGTTVHIYKQSTANQFAIEFLHAGGRSIRGNTATCGRRRTSRGKDAFTLRKEAKWIEKST